MTDKQEKKFNILEEFLKLTNDYQDYLKKLDEMNKRLDSDNKRDDKREGGIIKKKKKSEEYLPTKEDEEDLSKYYKKLSDQDFKEGKIPGSYKRGGRANNSIDKPFYYEDPGARQKIISRILSKNIPSFRSGGSVNLSKDEIQSRLKFLESEMNELSNFPGAITLLQDILNEQSLLKSLLKNIDKK